MSTKDLRSIITLPSQAGSNACFIIDKVDNNKYLYISGIMRTTPILDEQKIDNDSMLIVTKNSKYIIPSWLTVYRQ